MSTQLRTPQRGAQPLPYAGAMAHFPPGYEPRPQQREAIDRIEAAFGAGKRIVLLELPTGGGKSYITQTFARGQREAGGRTHFLTAQKILQDQYERDFPAPEIEPIKGRNAYGCTHLDAKPEDNAAYAPCTRRGKAILPSCVTDPAEPTEVTRLTASPAHTTCPYWKQLLTAIRAPITLYNFSSFLFQQRIGRFGKRDLIIVDEAHGTEGQLLSFIELSITKRQLEPIDASLPNNPKTAGEVADWIKRDNLIGRCEDALRGEGLPPDERERVERLAGKLETFLQYLDRTEWVLEVDSRAGRLVCRPVFAFDFADDLLFAKADRVLAVSATILDKGIWVRNLGLDPNEVEFIQMGSDFPVTNRPIQREYVGNMSFKFRDQTIPKLVRWVKEVCLPRHTGQRGIIHAHSFALARAIIMGVGSPRLLMHEPGQDKRDALRAHAVRPDSVLVAPAFHEGVDLKDDLSRFQVIAKAPYPNLKDPVLERRMAMAGGNEYYTYLTALKLVQSYGRSVRSKDDYAITYLTDSGFEGLMARASRILPKWFKEAVV